jgi:S1-C subfamily serine protease
MKILPQYFHRFRQPTFYLLLLLLGSSAGCNALRSQLGVPPLPQESVASLQSPIAVSPLPPPKLTSLDYVAQIVQRVGPAVVRIDSTRTVEQSFGDTALSGFLALRCHPRNGCSEALVLVLSQQQMGAS